MKNKDKLIAAVDKITKRENKTPDEVVEELNNMSSAEINNKFKNMDLFKDGGKLDQLVCMKKGGKTKKTKGCECGGKVEKAQNGRMLLDANLKTVLTNGADTLATGRTNRGADFVAKGTPRGRELAITVDTGSTGPKTTTYIENPTWLESIFYKKLNRANRQDVGSILKKEIPSEQEGGELSRKEALNNAQTNRGMSRRQARVAYRNAKAALREYGPEGLKGRELRQTARHAFDDTSRLNDRVPVVTAVVHAPAPVVVQNAQNPLDSAKYAKRYENGEFFGTSFNNAFSSARKMGLDVFKWKGNPYHTKYKEEMGNQAGTGIVRSEPLPIVKTPIIPRPVITAEKPIDQAIYMRNRDRMLLSDPNLVWPELGENVIYKPE